MSGMTPDLYRQNMIVILILQALCGTLTSAVKALTIEFAQGDEVTTYFLLREESSHDRIEIIENFPTELSAFTNGVPGVDEVVVRPIVQLVEEHPRGYVPPGRPVFVFRD